MQPDYSIPAEPEPAAAGATDDVCAIPTHPTAPASTPSTAVWHTTTTTRPRREGSSQPAAAAATPNGSTKGSGSESAAEEGGPLEVVDDSRCQLYLRNLMQGVTAGQITGVFKR